MMGDAVNDQDTVTSLALQPPRFTRQRPGARLIVVGGPDEGRYADVGEQAITLGTGTECDLRVIDPTVSRTHVRATWTGKAVRVVDLDSKNGSFHAGSRFRDLEVRPGDELVIGRTMVKVLPAEHPVSPDPIEASLFGDMVGASEAMRQVFSLIEQVAPTDAGVLIEGETGVGKELVAEEIHRRSRRRDRPFIVFDCGAVAADLIESTLFGHVKGAFTGAVADQVGLFEEADGGTLFLDEIGELDLHLQPVLLRAVDRGMIRSVGASVHRPVDVRIIAATHRHLGSMIADESFREDLYYRLSVVRLTVPPLRERPEDIPVLIQHFLRCAGRPDLRVLDDQMRRLSDYDWPGNVRQLQNFVDRGIVLARDGTLPIGELGPPPPAVRGGKTAERSGAKLAARKSFREAKAEVIDTFEREYLAALVDECPTLQMAADVAQMDRKHLRMLLRRYGLRSDG